MKYLNTTPRFSKIQYKWKTDFFSESIIYHKKHLNACPFNRGSVYLSSSNLDCFLLDEDEILPPCVHLNVYLVGKICLTDENEISTEKYVGIYDVKFLEDEKFFQTQIDHLIRWIKNFKGCTEAENRIVAFKKFSEPIFEE
jgi:hypothetical protein